MAKVVEWLNGKKSVVEKQVDSSDEGSISRAVRLNRNEMLRDSDWTQLSDAPLTDAQKKAWAAYRQKLRDLPEQAEFPQSVNWPEKPRWD